MFLEFVEREEPVHSPSWPLVEDYNRLARVALEAAPKLASILPPEIAIRPVDPDPQQEQPGPDVTYGQLLFFCQQIESFLN